MPKAHVSLHMPFPYPPLHLRPEFNRTFEVDSDLTRAYARIDALERQVAALSSRCDAFAQHMPVASTLHVATPAAAPVPFAAVAVAVPSTSNSRKKARKRRLLQTVAAAAAATATPSS